MNSGIRNSGILSLLIKIMYAVYTKAGKLLTALLNGLFISLNHYQDSQTCKDESDTIHCYSPTVVLKSLIIDTIQAAMCSVSTS